MHQHREDVVESHEAANATAKAEIEHLTPPIANMRCMQLGHKIEQLELRLEELEADKGAVPIEIPKATRTALEQVPRNPFPEHLPRENPDEFAGIGRGNLYGMWGAAEAARRRHLRTTRICPSQFPRDPLCAPETGVHVLRPHGAGGGAEQSHRAGLGWPGLASPYAGRQVRRPFTTVPPVGDLSTRGCRAGSLAAGEAANLHMFILTIQKNSLCRFIVVPTNAAHTNSNAPRVLR
ncbi:protein of unknown function [Burkholderia multivorans]